MRAPGLAAVLAGGLTVGCLLWRGDSTAPGPDVSAGLEEVDSEAIVDFYERASAFYARMAKRRFDTLATFEDPELRRYFRSEASFADYYADLASDLVESDFERTRPLALSVEEFLVEGPGQARVRVRIVGDNGLPLRFWEVVLEREDRWERLEGSWWIVPGRL